MSFLFSKPFSYLFFSTLLLGIFISLSASNWFIIWMGLELNLYSFIPLLISSKLNQEKEASIKYFLTQAFASALLLLSSLIFSYSIFRGLLLSTAIFIKLGIAPFHFWLPSVINRISWPMCWVLTTLQKIRPMSIIIYTMPLSSYTISVAIIRALVGGLGGLNQTQLRAIFAYSSIGHIAWIVRGAIVSVSLSILYFSAYLIIISSIILPIIFLHIKSINYSLFSDKNLSIQTILILAILRLGGIPPLFGFFPKLFTIYLIIKSNIFFLCLILLIRSSINLYYYTKILIGLFFSFSSNSPWRSKTKINGKLLLSTIFTLTIATAIIFPLIIPYSFYALTLFY